MDKECPICGAKFMLKSNNQKYCSTRCKKEAQRQRVREYDMCHKSERHIRNAEAWRRYKEKGKPPRPTLDETVAAADAAGMSYGQYVIQQKLKKERD